MALAKPMTNPAEFRRTNVLQRDLALVRPMGNSHFRGFMWNQHLAWFDVTDNQSGRCENSPPRMWAVSQGSNGQFRPFVRPSSRSQSLMLEAVSEHRSRYFPRMARVQDTSHTLRLPMETVQMTARLVVFGRYVVSRTMLWRTDSQCGESCDFRCGIPTGHFITRLKRRSESVHSSLVGHPVMPAPGYRLGLLFQQAPLGQLGEVAVDLGGKQVSDPFSIDQRSANQLIDRATDD